MIINSKLTALKNPLPEEDLDRFIFGLHRQGNLSDNLDRIAQAKAQLLGCDFDEAMSILCDEIALLPRLTEPKTDSYLAGQIEAGLNLKKKDSDDESGVYISALLTKAIASVYPRVKKVTSAKKKGESLVGYFRDRLGGVFFFEITNDRIKAESIIRKDSDEELKCRPGYEQRGAACQKIVISDPIPPAAQTAVNLADKMIETGELPSRKELAHALGATARQLLQNPVKTVKEGFEREKKFKEAYQTATGKAAPTKGEVAKEAAQRTAEYVKEHPEVVKEQAMFIGSSIGATAGKAVGGPIGELAGDLGGAMAVRAVFTADEAARRAHAKLAKDEAFQKASKLQKLKQLGAATLAELKSEEMKKKVAAGTDEDVAGWVAGNVVGKTMDLVKAPSLAAIGVASAGAAHAAPKMVKAKERIQSGEDAGTVIKETAKEIFANEIKKGNEREAKLREKVNKEIKRYTEPIRKARGK